MQTAKKSAVKSSPRGLGKGLSALMSDSYSQIVNNDNGEAPEKHSPERTLPLDALTSGKYQPREFFDTGALADLSESIRKNGIMQPILVRPLVAGIMKSSPASAAGARRAWRG